VIALERDVPSLVHWSEQTYQAVFTPGAAERILWVIEEHGHLRGFLVARFTLSECELENLVVAAGSRRRGSASTLLQALIDEARVRHLERILLEVRPSNPAARALYERFGFRVEGNRKNYYSQPPEDAIVLVLSLNCTSAGAPNR
jgi:ribosomal-protein-alanine N-acetyltransferase